MTTRLQTVEIYKRGVPFRLFGLEEAPIMPAGYELRADGDELVVQGDDGVRYSWNSSKRWKECRAEYLDGTVKVWYLPPTMKEAVAKDTEISFIQFHGDGSVSCRGYGGNYWWSAPRASAAGPVRGTVDLYYCECSACSPTHDVDGYSYSDYETDYDSDPEGTRESARYRWYERD